MGDQVPSKRRGNPAWIKGGASPNPSGRALARADASPARADGWQNLLTMVGTSRDKRRSGTFETERMTFEEARELWRGNDIAARIVEKFPDEMLRAGFEIKIQADESAAVDTRASSAAALRGDAFGGGGFGGGPPAPAAPARPPGVIQASDDEPKRNAEALEARLEELGATDALHEAMCYARAHGGGAVLIGVDDGLPASEPVNEAGIRSIKWLTTLTSREIIARQYHGNPSAPRYGLPELYEIQPRGIPLSSGGTFAPVVVHESRILAFQGVVVDRDQLYENNGWGDSVLVRVRELLSDFGQTWAGAAALMTDFAQAVYKMGGLAELMASSDEDMVRRRLEILDSARSILRMVVIDDQDEIRREQTPLSGLPEMLDRFAGRVAAAAEMPVSILMGEAPAGLNATGQADISNFYDTIAARQAKHLRPPLDRLVRLLMLAKDGPTRGVEPANWSVGFKSLTQASEAEQAAIRKTQAETDAIYLTNGVVTPEEIAASRFGGDAWSGETSIDFAAREELGAAHEAEVAQYEIDKAKAAEDAAKTAAAAPAPDEAVPGKPAAPGGEPEPEVDEPETEV